LKECKKAATGTTSQKFKDSCDPEWSAALAKECDSAKVRSDAISASFTYRCTKIVEKNAAQARKALMARLVKDTSASLVGTGLNDLELEIVQLKR